MRLIDSCITYIKAQGPSRLVTRVKKKKKIELFLRIETTRIGKIINFRSIALQGYHEQNMLKGHLPRVIYHQVY